jgi:hypothetical protein
MRIVVIFALLIVWSACADRDLEMKCLVNIPEEYQRPSVSPPPNGEPEPVRYQKAYEAFWWNCVAVRATDLAGRCPFAASGTAAASAGASDGAKNAENRISDLLRKYSEQAVQEYLRSIASQSEATEKMRHYFDKATSEVVK